MSPNCYDVMVQRSNHQPTEQLELEEADWVTKSPVRHKLYRVLLTLFHPFHLKENLLSDNNPQVRGSASRCQVSHLHVTVPPFIFKFRDDHTQLKSDVNTRSGSCFGRLVMNSRLRGGWVFGVAGGWPGTQ